MKAAFCHYGRNDRTVLRRIGSTLLCRASSENMRNSFKFPTRPIADESGCRRHREEFGAVASASDDVRLLVQIRERAADATRFHAVVNELHAENSSASTEPGSGLWILHRPTWIPTPRLQEAFEGMTLENALVGIVAITSGVIAQREGHAVQDVLVRPESPGGAGFGRIHPVGDDLGWRPILGHMDAIPDRDSESAGDFPQKR